MNKTAAIVVTYNRKKMLMENINALLNQSVSCDIYIIDNNSDDGTEEAVKSINSDKITYVNTKKNLGGAGGFSLGCLRAVQDKHEYVWLMDDDAIPNLDALEILEKKAKFLNNEFSFLASMVYWTNGEIFPMNIPGVNYKNNLDVKFDLISNFDMAPIISCSFVGCFVNCCAIIEKGLPISEFFIYGDDIEFTSRIVKWKPAFLALKSKIIHKAPSIVGADIIYADSSRISRFYFQCRNGMYMAKKKGFLSFFERLLRMTKRVFKILFKSPNNKLKRIHVLLSGTISGLFFNPKIQFPKFEEDK